MCHFSKTTLYIFEKLSTNNNFSYLRLNGESCKKMVDKEGGRVKTDCEYEKRLKMDLNGILRTEFMRKDGSGFKSHKGRSLKHNRLSYFL